MLDLIPPECSMRFIRKSDAPMKSTDSPTTRIRPEYATEPERRVAKRLVHNCFII